MEARHINQIALSILKSLAEAQQAIYKGDNTKTLQAILSADTKTRRLFSNKADNFEECMKELETYYE